MDQTLKALMAAEDKVLMAHIQFLGLTASQDSFELPLPTGRFGVMPVPPLHPLLLISCFKCFLLVLYALCFSLHVYSEG